MDDKKAKGRKTVLPAANSFSNPDAAGWIYKLIHEGWMRKRWRKRYGVLSNGILYLYEQQKSDGTEKTCGTVNMKNYGECVKAPRKECKKSPNTLILEPAKKKEEGKESNKSSKQTSREYLYTETPEELEVWLAKLQESLSMANIGGDSKLTHITKTRARPPRGGGGNRRPPTKQHLKERAKMSEVSLDAQEAEQVSNGPAKKRGNIPTSALRPPPGGGKAAVKPPKSPEPVDETAKSESNGDVEKVENGDEDIAPETSPVRSPMTPKPPPAALKPPSTKRVAVVRNESTSSAGSQKSLPPPPESPPISDDAKSLEEEIEKLSSKHSSKTSSLDRKENGSVKSLSEPGSPPLPPSPLLDDSSNVDENHNEEGVVEESNVSPTKLEKLKDKFNLDLSKNERILKARSMMDLDRDSEDETLPPPPSPPPSPSLEIETNGKIHIENVEIDKKVKKLRGSKKTRPASLVLDV